MKTWDLILCQNTFFRLVVNSMSFLSDDIDIIDSRRAIMQHHIVISDNLVAAYKEYAKEHGEWQSFQDFLDEYAMSTGTVKSRVFKDVFDPPVDSNDIDEAIISASKDDSLSSPLVVCDKCEKCSLFTERIKPTQSFLSPLLSKPIISNVIQRNTAPFEVSTVMNEPCSFYSAWIADIFQDEQKITFFDRYMLNAKGFASFQKHYLPAINPGTTVQMFVDINCREDGYQRDYDNNRSTLIQLAKQYSIRIIVSNFNHYKYKVYKKSYHDRRIFVSGYKVSLTAGIDFMPGTDIRIHDSGVEVKLKKSDSAAEIRGILCDYNGYQIILDTDKA